MVETIPASTLILLRNVAGGAPETLMVQRAAHMSFAANRMVFPGGRIDEDDRLIAAQAERLVGGQAIDPDDLAARIAAIRETIEEVGLAPGVVGLNDAVLLQQIRAGLHEETAFSALLETFSLRLDPYALEPFARWVPPAIDITRRFDTRFYVAAAPALGEAAADGTESSHCVWATADAHLAAGSMIFPTIRNLERLAQVRDVEDGIAFCRRYPIDIVSPTVEDRDGVPWLCIQEGLGYPVTAQLLDQAVRDPGLNRPSRTRPPG